MVLGPVPTLSDCCWDWVVSMAAPALVDLIYGNPDWKVFAASLVLFVAVSLFLSTRGAGSLRLNLRQAFLLTNLSWLSIACAAAIPFAFSELPMSGGLVLRGDVGDHDHRLHRHPGARRRTARHPAGGPSCSGSAGSVSSSWLWPFSRS